MTDPRPLAETVRAACIQAALEAYEEGGVRGLCAEGRWEYAISAMRQLDLAAILNAPSTLDPNSPIQTGPWEDIRQLRNKEQ
ncbi:MAG: acetyltransferase [Candidatus Contendobacter sp.]|nr:acetyltransferase [Candidatus Contendobacter sp.]